MLHGLLGKLDSKAIGPLITKEVVGINVPKIVIARQPEERWDTATSEIGNTVAAFGGGWLLDKLLKRVFEAAQKQGAGPLSHQWAVLGRSGAIFSALFSLMWGIPFIRNVLTARRTGTVDFKGLIANEDTSDKSEAQQRLPQPLKVAQATAEAKRKAFTVLGLGLAGVVLSVGLAKGAIWSAFNPKWLQKLFSAPGEALFSRKANWLKDSLLLKGGSFLEIPKWSQLLFWGVPAYAGWFHASRDPIERKEQPLKFLAFVASFFGPEWVTGKIFPNKPQAWKTGFGMLMSIAMLTVLQLVNFRLTERRLARDEAHPRMPVQPLPPGQLTRKTFPQWGRRALMSQPAANA